MDRLAKKFEKMRARMPAPEIRESKDREIGIIACGTSHWAIVESLDQLKQEYDIEASYMRLRAFPFNEQAKDFIRSHRRVYIIDQNRDGQLYQLLRLDIDAEEVTKLRSVLHYSGLPIDARSVTDEIVSQEGVK